MWTRTEGPRTGLLRVAVPLASSALAAALCLARALPRLDVALWAVLVPIVAAVVLELAARASRRLRALRRPAARVVVPDAARPAVPDPAVQARGAVVARARASLLEAQVRQASLGDLLALAHALHEAELDLARATASAGGHVPQAVRDELLLRDRPATVPSP